MAPKAKRSGGKTMRKGGSTAKSGSKKEQKKDVDDLLRSKDILKRFAAVDLLKERGDIERLRDLLFNESWHLRERAAQALASFGERVGDLVRPLLDEGYWYVRASAAFVVGEIGDVKSFEKLKELMTERNETVRSEACKAIAKLIIKNASLAEKLSLDERVVLENTLKSIKEFDLLDAIKSSFETAAILEKERPQSAE